MIILRSHSTFDIQLLCNYYRIDSETEVGVINPANTKIKIFPIDLNSKNTLKEWDIVVLEYEK